MATKTITDAHGNTITAETHRSTMTGAPLVDISTQGSSVTYAVAGLLEQPHPHFGLPMMGVSVPFGSEAYVIDGPTVDVIRDWLFDLISI